MSSRIFRTIVVTGGFLLSSLAFSASDNTRVFVETDAQGVDQSINVEFNDPADVEELKAAFGSDLTLSDTGEVFTIDCSSNSKCLITFSQDGAVYRQRLDERIKGYDLSAASSAELFTNKWQGNPQKESCDFDDCAYFDVKHFRSNDGEFMLQCNERVTTSDKHFPANCFMRIDILDVMTEN